MSNDDKKLPARTDGRALSPLDDEGALPRATTGIIDTIATGFGSDLKAFGYRKQANKLERQREAVAAARGVAVELKGLAKDLHALRNVDAEIAGDDIRAAHAWAKEDHEREGERAKWAREDEASSFTDVTAQVEAETKLALARKTLAQAQYEATKAEWGQEAWGRNMDHRKRRVDALRAKGATDAELERMATEDVLEEERGGASRADDQEIAALKREIERIKRKIEHASQTKASEGLLLALYELKAELDTDLEQKTENEKGPT